MLRYEGLKLEKVIHRRNPRIFSHSDDEFYGRAAFLYDIRYVIYYADV
jgi:hypothetical protein